MSATPGKKSEQQLVLTKSESEPGDITVLYFRSNGGDMFMQFLAGTFPSHYPERNEAI